MPPRRGPSSRPGAERLGVDECWRLLGTRSLGRVCVSVDDRVHVALTSYVVRSECLYFRATSFGALARQVPARTVTLEVDDLGGTPAAGWAVTVTGSTRRVVDATTLALLWSPAHPVAWEVGLEPWWVALDPDTVEGRRLRG